MADVPRYHLGLHDRLLDYQATMLADAYRVVGYERAIRALVKPGDVVLDLGAGSGVLAMLAARRGARVHAVESAPVANLARDLVRDNGLSDRVTVHHADICDMAVVEPVDLVVSDFMGRFLVDDGMLDAVAAAARWLKPGGRFCPSYHRLVLAPAWTGLEGVDPFASSMLGLDLRGALPYAMNTCYAAQLGAPNLLARGQAYHEWEPRLPAPPLDASLVFEVERPGALTAFAGWFDCTLAPGIYLSTGPGVQTHWGQYLFPVPRTEVRPGDELRIHLRLVGNDGEPDWHWSTEIRRDGTVVAAFVQESLQRLGERDLPARTPPEPLDREALIAANAGAAQAFIAGDIAAARDALEQVVLRVRPDDDDLAPALYENLGLARLNASDHLGAIRAFMRSLDGDLGSREQVLRLLVTALHRVGRVHDAATHLAAYRAHFGEHPDFPAKGWEPGA